MASRTTWTVLIREKHAGEGKRNERRRLVALSKLITAVIIAVGARSVGTV